MDPKPLGALDTVATPVQPHVELQSSKMLIHELAVERPDILDYIRTIAPDKQEIALVHALEVGVTEIVARRRSNNPRSRVP
jgi:hypothetical protein